MHFIVIFHYKEHWSCQNEKWIEHLRFMTWRKYKGFLEKYFPKVVSVSEWRLARPAPGGCCGCWECEAVEAGPRAGQEAVSEASDSLQWPILGQHCVSTGQSAQATQAEAGAPGAMPGSWRSVSLGKSRASSRRLSRRVSEDETKCVTFRSSELRRGAVRQERCEPLSCDEDKCHRGACACESWCDARLGYLDLYGE